jgi:hypothetical protein
VRARAGGGNEAARLLRRQGTSEEQAISAENRRRSCTPRLRRSGRQVRLVDQGHGRRRAVERRFGLAPKGARTPPTRTSRCSRVGTSSPGPGVARSQMPRAGVLGRRRVFTPSGVGGSEAPRYGRRTL